MENSSFKPDTTRLSIMIATILLVYAVTQFIRPPENQIALQLPGFFLPIPINFRDFIWFGVAVLAAAGMDWLLIDYPDLSPRQRSQHWLLPALTAWVIGVPLYALPSGAAWWLVYILGGLLLILVFWGEFYTVTPRANSRQIAALGLTGMSYALFVVLAAGLRFSITRLYLVAPAVMITSGLIALRALYLHTHGDWHYNWSVAVALLMGQLAIGFHYLPLNAIQYGMLLVGFLYAVISLAGRAAQHNIQRSDLYESGVAIAVALLLAFLMG